MENGKFMYGIDTFEQYENIETDTVIYSLKKFVTLCLNANPNVIELLGVEDSEILPDEPDKSSVSHLQKKIYEMNGYKFCD